MNIHDIDSYKGFTRMVIPEIALVVKRNPMIAELQWEGKRLGDSEWATGDLAFVPAGSEMVSRMVKAYAGTLITVDKQTLEEAALDVDIRMSELHFAAISNADVTRIAAPLLAMAETGVLDRHPTLAEAMSVALTVEVTRAIVPDFKKKMERLRPGLSHDRKRRVVEFVTANLHRPITLADMAAQAHLSPYHFSRSFKESTGMSPVAFLLRQRIKTAKQMLKGRETLAGIAHACGFSSQSHFTTAFKSMTGSTPASYRSAVSA